MVCLRQFSIMRDAYDDIFAVSRSLRSKQIEFAVAKEKIEQDVSKLNAQWSAYRATNLTPEEEVLAKDLQERIDQNGVVISEILKRIAQGGTPDFEATHTDLLKTMQVTNATLGKLTALQVREAEAEFNRSEDTAGWSRIALLAALVLAAFSIAYGVLTIVMQVTRPLNRLVSVFAANGPRRN